MATYFNGNPEISIGQDGGLQTMVLMNPTTTYAQFNNNSTPNALHPPPHHQQQFDGVSVLHAYVPPVHHHHHHHYNNPHVTFNSGEGARETPRAGGLSLSLSSSNTCFGGNANGVVLGMQSLVVSSKYVKAAQELLEEVVSVDNCRGGGGSIHKGRLSGDGGGGTKERKVGDETDCGGGATGTKVAAEITAAERQEIQTKKAKLISMLDEVNQRYRQYKQQMQTVISTFEQAAGPNSAKPYTSLALKTISKQFRTLKDTITAQIRAANKTLGEEEDPKKEGESSSRRLKFVDHQLRQQRALQQLGMIQHNNNAWRPQRGLPERAVSVLRAWLLEHFLHPYPKDSDKIILAKQTGLTRSQVSNWFINARVRLWKPMVEEMYIEEMKDQENSNGSEEKTGKNKQQQHKEDSASNLISFNKNQEQQNSVLEDQGTGFKPKQETFINTHIINPSISVPNSVSTSPTCGNFRNPSGFPSTGPLELEGITQWRSPKKPRSSSSIDDNIKQFSMELRDDETRYSFIDNNANFVGGFEEAEQFHTARYSGNGVLLTLGLPHCESFSVSGTHQDFLPNQNIPQQPNEFGSMNASAPHSSAAYDTISIQNQRRFVAQLLPDYVS